MIFLLMILSITSHATYFDSYLNDVVKSEKDYCRLVVEKSKTQECLSKIENYIAAVNTCDTTPQRLNEAKESDEKEQILFLSEQQKIETPFEVLLLFKKLTAAAKTYTHPSQHDWKITTYLSEDKAAQSSAGGHIILSSGLWTGTNPMNFNEIAAVIAHEVSHTLKNHSLQFGCLAMAWTVKDVPLSVAYEDFKKNANAAYPNGQAWTKLGHRVELEADEHGIYLLKKVGLDPMLMPQMLEKLKKSGLSIDSHPDTKLRIENARNKALKI